MSINYAQADRVVTRPSGQTSRNEIRSIDPWKHTSEKRLERILSSSLLAGDNEVETNSPCWHRKPALRISKPFCGVPWEVRQVGIKILDLTLQ
jgi:hypothetical protein